MPHTLRILDRPALCSGIALDALEQLPCDELWPSSFRVPHYHNAVDEEVAYFIAAWIKGGVRSQLGHSEIALALLSGQNIPRCAVRPGKCRIILGDRRCNVQILRQTKQEAGQRGPPTFVFKQTRSDRTDALTSANPSKIPSGARESSSRIGTSAAVAADQCLSQSKVRNGT